MLACVYSKSQEDNKPSENVDTAAVRAELEAHYLDDDAEKAAKKAFKARGADPQILIVCDKLLTGFDAPIEHVMYLDKPLKEHNLLQAIARTNRTYAFKGSPEARSIVRFRELNLLGDWPMQQPFDVIFCRNVMIYFDLPTKERLVARFAAQLQPGGYLYIGHSERVTGPAAALLEPVGPTIYRKRSGS